MIHCAVMISAGSRNETPQNDGIAHFIEHSVFKGTERKKSKKIFATMEDLGGEINAYTTRDKTCYYTTCRSQFADKALDLLADIAFAPSFPQKELDKEKGVIIEEIDMYSDLPDECIFDEWHKYLYPNHSLGHNILGTVESVKNISAEQCQAWRKEHYRADNTVIATVGKMTAAEAQALVHKQFAPIEFDNKPILKLEQPSYYNSSFQQISYRDFSQAHCTIGNFTFNKLDPKQNVLGLINTYLSHAGMSARLNMILREKHGLTYNVSTSNLMFTDSGNFSIYFGCDDKHVFKALDLVQAELKLLCDKKLATSKLDKTKNQLMGHIAQMLESPSAQLQRMARMSLDFNHVYTYADVEKVVKAITVSDIIEVANQVFDPIMQNVLIYREQK